MHKIKSLQTPVSEIIQNQNSLTGTKRSVGRRSTKDRGVSRRMKFRKERKDKPVGLDDDDDVKSQEPLDGPRRRGQDALGDQWGFKSSKGLDYEWVQEEEDKYHKVVSRKQSVADPLYMEGFTHHGSYVNSHSVLLNLLLGSNKDPHANLLAAKIGLKEDDAEGNEIEQIYVIEFGLPCDDNGGHTNSGRQRYAKRARRDPSPHRQVNYNSENGSCKVYSSNSGWRNFAKGAQRNPSSHRQVRYNSEQGSCKVNSELISFSDKDLEGIETPHNDALVVVMTVANSKVFRILIDSGSSANVLFFSAFEKMGLSERALVHDRPVKKVLVGLFGESVEPLGIITLPVKAGEEPKSSTVMVDFYVMDCPAAYNIIFGRPGIQALRGVPSTYHLLLRFPSKAGIGEVRGDQLKARECYKAALELKLKKQD